MDCHLHVTPLGDLIEEGKTFGHRTPKTEQLEFTDVGTKIREQRGRRLFDGFGSLNTTNKALGNLLPSFNSKNIFFFNYICFKINKLILKGKSDSEDINNYKKVFLKTNLIFQLF